eukprot:478701-Prymnesium_polylepis.1
MVLNKVVSTFSSGSACSHVVVTNTGGPMICSNAPGGFSLAAWRPIYRMRRNSSADASSDPSSRNFGQFEWFLVRPRRVRANDRASSSGTRLDAGTTPLTAPCWLGGRRQNTKARAIPPGTRPSA